MLRDELRELILHVVTLELSTWGTAAQHVPRLHVERIERRLHIALDQAWLEAERTEAAKR